MVTDRTAALPADLPTNMPHLHVFLHPVPSPVQSLSVLPKQCGLFCHASSLPTSQRTACLSSCLPSLLSCLFPLACASCVWHLCHPTTDLLPSPLPAYPCHEHKHILRFVLQHHAHHHSAPSTMPRTGVRAQLRTHHPPSHLRVARWDAADYFLSILHEPRVTWLALPACRKVK